MIETDPALIAAVAETKVERYRYLALEQPDAAERATWQRWILAGRPTQTAAVAVAPSAAIAVDYGSAPSPARPCGSCPGSAIG